MPAQTTRRALLVATGAAMLAIGAGRSARGAPADPAAKPTALSLHIAVSEVRGVRPIIFRDGEATLPVLVTNALGAPVRLWQTVNSWGYRSVSLAYATADGRKGVLRRREIHFKQNTATFFTLTPGESHVFLLELGDSQWEGVPVPTTDAGLALTLQAIYEVKPDEQSAKNGVWTGRILSSVLPVHFEGRER